MGLTLMGILTENTDRIVTGASPGALNYKAKTWIEQGYKPYIIKNAKIIPLLKPTMVQSDTEWDTETDSPKMIEQPPKPFKIKIDYNGKIEDNTIYFLSDKEYGLIKRAEDNITQIIEHIKKQLNLYNEYLPAFAREILKRGTNQ